MATQVEELAKLFDRRFSHTDGLYPKPNAAYNPKVKVTTPQAKAARPSQEQFLEKLATDKDGSIILRQYIGNPKNRNRPVLIGRYNLHDANKDAQLTLEELKKPKCGSAVSPYRY